MEDLEDVSLYSKRNFMNPCIGHVFPCQCSSKIFLDSSNHDITITPPGRNHAGPPQHSLDEATG